MQYFNDKVDKLVNNVLDYISSEKLIELYPEISNLEKNLEQESDTQITFDEIDRQIVTLLTQDGRMKLVDLGGFVWCFGEGDMGL